MALQIKPVRGDEFPRKFTAGVADFGDWPAIEPLFKKLVEQGKAIKSKIDLEAWIAAQSELATVLSEERGRRYIAMTCQTDDKELEASFLQFLEHIQPKTKGYWNELQKIYLASPHRRELDPKRYEVLDRDVENDVEMFREENIPLQTEDSKLRQQYQSINGAMTVTFRGEEKTMPQLNPFLEETDRATREEAWRVGADRRLQDKDKLDELFDKMIELRGQIAKNAGYENFRDYQHQALGRFDYKPEDCFKFHDAVEKHVVPLLRKVREERAQKLGVPTLRPWDLKVSADGGQPLRPFKDGKQLEEGCAAIFNEVDPELGKQFTMMREMGLLDLVSRKGKAPGGYQSTLEEVRYPFIFMNAAGTDRDVYTLLHEGGHAFHAFAARKEPLVFYRHAPIEFCEVASMTMELFAYDSLDKLYSKEDALRSRRKHTEELLDLFPWIATIDAFQHWIYTHPNHTHDEREAKWVELESRFSPGVDWSGLEPYHRAQWHRQLHIFEVPFYYIEYGIAQLGALQLWLKAKQNRAATIESYSRGLALGGSRPLPELFETAGARFDFSDKTIAPIADAIEAELEATAA